MLIEKIMKKFQDLISLQTPPRGRHVSKHGQKKLKKKLIFCKSLDCVIMSLNMVSNVWMS